MMSFVLPQDVQLTLAGLFQERRKSKKHSRNLSAELTGVPSATIRRFEVTGQISFAQFLMLVNVYGDLAIADNLFPAPKASSIDELMKQSKG